ncbi:hypothetical protein BHE90_005182 [Fusarium euwallaceae]|uniref:F-box domain-containing protein n=1 Tax=Fusarium euwallaceae TaxID=1147111 RepID=A0A430LX55_9HYPO|nr:hypothetical protein BHE90_005182 [Fusarium euwallaceae]
MGGRDTWCALCGAVTRALWWQDVDDGEDDCYDHDVITQEDTLWLGECTLVATGNSEEGSEDDSFHLIPATYWDHGAFEFDTEEGGGGMRSAYDDGGDLAVAFPIHDACFEQLRRILAPKSIDPGILYRLFDRYSSPPAGPLDISYGGIEEYHEQYWPSTRGVEYIVSSPCSSPELQAWYRSLIKPIPENQEKPPVIRESLEPGNDPFEKLQPEILLHIMSYMVMPHAWPWRIASRAVARLELRESFWKLRFQQDFPWLYDFPWIDRDLAEKIDWETLYKRMWRAVLRPSPEKNLALANRYRMWHIIEWVADVYLDYKEDEDQGQSNEPVSLVDAVSTPLASPTCAEFEHSIHEETLLLRDFNEFPTVQPSIEVGWTPLGELKSIAVGYIPWLASRSVKKNRVAIPTDCWLKGIVITTEKNPINYPRIIGLKFLFPDGGNVQLGEAEGDEREELALPDHFIVGFKAAETLTGTISRLGLVQQPVWKVPNRRRLLGE